MAGGETMSPSWPLGWLLLLVMLGMVAAVPYSRAPAGRVRVAQVARSALLFAVLGPPLGALLVGVPAMLTTGDPEPGTMLLFLVAMSYVPGLVPALVGGACMGLLRPTLRTGARLGAAALLCGFAAGAFGVGVLDLPLSSLPPMLGLGAASGAALEAGWLWRERPRRPAAAAS